MGKNKNKKKKISAKKERYAKFRKEKPSSMTFTIPTSSPELQKQRLEDERNIEYFLRHSRNIPSHEVSERKEKSKR